MFSFTVTPDEGDTYEIEASSRDVVLWERTHKDNSLKRLESNLRMTDMYGLAHVAAKRQGLFSGTFNEFVESVDIEMPDAEEAGPTNPGH